MRHAYLLLAPLALVACGQAADPSSPGESSGPTPSPSLGAAVLTVPNNYFLIYDDVPERNYTVTFGLVSSPSDLVACGGSGPEVYDGGGTTRIVETPSGALHIRDELHQATIVFYEGPTPDVCDLVNHPVIGTGTGNLHFTQKAGANGSFSIQATFGGILDLVAGGRARMLGVGNIRFDQFGSLSIHEDHFELKPIGP